MKKKYMVSGMSCSACSAAVNRAVSKLNGVSDVNVNLLTGEMVVDYDIEKTSSTDIVSAVSAAGYSAEEFIKLDLKKNNTDLSEQHILKNRFIISVILLIPMLYVSMGHMFGAPLPDFLNPTYSPIQFVAFQFIITTVIVCLNYIYFTRGFKLLFKLHPNMDSLIALGAGASMIYSIVISVKIIINVINGNMDDISYLIHDIYYESAATILTLIDLGKYLQSKAEKRSTDAIAGLIKLRPDTACVLRDGKEVKILAQDVNKKDIIIVKAGETIPVDGYIIDGYCAVDQSILTGESLPVDKKTEDYVYAGTIVRSGYIRFTAEKIYSETNISGIIDYVKNAASSKAPISGFADKVSSVFVPIVIGISAISFLVWILVTNNLSFSLSIAISVLVISCPCALGLATPVAIMAGMGAGAENGILIRSAKILEQTKSVDTVVFDKTGTLTTGELHVTDVISLSEEKSDTIRDKCAALEMYSSHPLAKAIVNSGDSSLYEFTDCVYTEGRGISGKNDNTICYAGNKEYLQENNIIVSYDASIFTSQGKTVVYYAEDNKLTGLIVLGDTLRKSCRDAVHALKKLGIEIIMITGDSNECADYISKQAGIDKFLSNVLPQNKAYEITKFRQNGKIIAMVGDGVNDAPALTCADIGIAVGSGSDIAMDCADIVLMSNDIISVADVIRLSRSTISNIKLSLFWAFIYNCVGIVFAAGVFYHSLGFTLSPIIAAAAMSLSSVCVVTNALRLLAFKPINRKENRYMQKIIKIEGMHCDHCKASVQKALLGVDGVVSADVNLKKKTAKLNLSKQVEDKDLFAVIEDAGFTVSL